MTESHAETYFAPAERAAPEELEAARAAFAANEVAMRLLEAIPDPAVVLNPQRQIIAANGRLRQLLGVASLPEVLGLRLGEAIDCMHCPDTEGGCGTGPFCVHCGAVQAILEGFETRTSTLRECRLLSTGERALGALDVEVQATFVEVTGTGLLVVALRDISAEKRRQVLERVFFHDVLNTAVALNALAQFISTGQVPEIIQPTYKDDLLRVSEQMVEEIVAQRQLLAAERGELRPSVNTVHVRSLLESVIARFRPWEATERPSVIVSEPPEGRVVTDTVLLRRVLSNLVKNGLEAIGEGETVTVRAREEGDHVVFEVHNPGVMPEDVQRQIFQRSFSTKAGRGRGIGTYSIRLFTERYLGGQVTFESREPEGTTFRVTVPREPASPGE